MAVRSILNGRFAEAAVGGVLLALLTDWSVEFETTNFDGTGPGDVWEYRLPLVSHWEFRAKGYVVPGAPPQYVNSLWRQSAEQQKFQVTGYSGTVASGTKIFEGTGYPIKGSFDAPMELCVQTFVIRGYGAPTTGIQS